MLNKGEVMKRILIISALLLAVSLLAACNLPSWLTYTNATYHFQFQYPPASTIETDSPTSARIQLPFTAGTNLVEKFLDVSVQSGVALCLSPYAEGWAPGSLTPEYLTINGLDFTKESASEGAMGSTYAWTAYSTSQGSTCVSLSFVLHSHPTDFFTPPLPAFDDSAESLVFAMIVDTFTWLISPPTCDTASLIAPALIDPADGAVVNTLNPTLHWVYPDTCVPEGYRIDLSVDPTFTDTSLSGGTGNPSTNWGPGTPLTDCTTYFWRVAPINGITLGPFSSAFTFRTDVHGTCPAEAPASIHGVVWLDLCPVAMDASPAPDPLPTGCVLDSYGVDADGIHQGGEPYVFGITVNLGPGDCPVGGPLSTTTDGSGAFAFTGLTPGKYCLNVNGVSIVGLGGSGHWTLVPGGHEANSYRSILLAAGQNLTGQDFAWYTEGGPTPTPVPTDTPTATPTMVPPAGPFFIPDMNVNCHFGPGLNFATYDVAMKDIPYLLDGRNSSNDWFRIMFDSQHGCWVLKTSGHTSGDISHLRVLISPATPTPVPVSCDRLLTKDSCTANPACTWVQATSYAGGVCRNK
jgi:hypothetical protein